MKRTNSISMDDEYNLLIDTDGYKPSHWLQFPPGTEGYFGYISARAAEAVCYGLQYYLMKYISRPITMENIEEADKYYEEYFYPFKSPFNRKGWEYVLDTYNGYMPVTIKCAPEGSVIPKGEVMITIEATDKNCYWVAPYLETALVRIWYPSTVATYSRNCKKVLMKYMEMSCDNPLATISKKLHCFGARGTETLESSGIGGSAHLVNFEGSDTCYGARVAMKYYNAKMPAHSIYASEHGTITPWGRENEAGAYRNMIKQFGKPGNVFACVSDSWNIDYACEHIWGEELRDEVIKSGAYVVVRPDSGALPDTPIRCLTTLESKYGSTINTKGFKVLNHVGVIQGDYMNIGTLDAVCAETVKKGISIDSINFGMGASLIQDHTRDELGFAMKCSATKVGGKWNGCQKSPVGDPMKKSKAGRISLYRKNGHGTEYVTMRIEEAEEALKDGIIEEALQTVYANGKLYNETTFDEVRRRASL